MNADKNALFEKLLKQVGSIPGVEIPPKIFIEMQGKVIQYVEKKSITVRFPNQPKYQNPMGYMQGGVIVAAVDNTFGPLSFLVAPPSATTQINTQYIRPVLPEDKFIEVTAFLVERTKTQILMRAEVTNERQKLIAISQSTHQIIGSN